MTRPVRARLRLAIPLIALAVGRPVLHAQQVDTSAYVASFITAGRPEDELRSGIERAQVEEQNAAREADRIKQYRDQLAARVNVQRADIGALKSRTDLAKKEGRDADRADLELRRRKAELDQKTFEQVKSLYEAQVGELEARRDWERARGKSYEAELNLSRKRTERMERQTADSTSLGRLDADIYSLEGKMLEARKAEADRQATWASRYRSTVDRQISVYRAQASARSTSGR